MSDDLIFHGFEVVQALQDIDNSVLLVQGKRTYVRVYLSAAAPLYGAKIDGKLSATSDGKFILDSLDAISKIEVFKDQKIDDLRSDWSLSLNFEIADDFWQSLDSSADIEVQFKFELTKYDADNTSEVVSFSAEPNVKPVIFSQPISLSLRIVNYRYMDLEDGAIYQPSDGDNLAFIEFVRAAYPVTSVVWSSIYIDAPSEFNKLQKIEVEEESAIERVDLLYKLLFQHLLALRNQEISRDGLHDNTANMPSAANPIPAKTIYIGMLDDPTDRFAGVSMDTPKFYTPHVVAFSGLDSNGMLPSHELAHLLGQLHPGIPNKKLHGKLGQKNQLPKSEKQKINNIGLISGPSENKQIGLDSRNHPARPDILLADENFDLMTYRYPQWVSKYTYEGLYDRIKNLKPREIPETDKYLTVIGEYNLNTRTAKINYVLRSSVNVRPHQDQLDKLGIADENVEFLYPLELVPVWGVTQSTTSNIWEHRVYTRSNPLLTDANTNIGVFQHSIELKHLENGKVQIPDKLELRLMGAPVDVYDMYDSVSKVFEKIENPDNLLTNHPPLSEIIKSYLNFEGPDANGQSQNIPIDSRYEIEDDGEESENSQVAKLELLYSVDEGEHYVKFNFLEGSKHAHRRVMSLDDERSKVVIDILSRAGEVENDDPELQGNTNTGLRQTKLAELVVKHFDQIQTSLSALANYVDIDKANYKAPIVDIEALEKIGFQPFELTNLAYAGSLANPLGVLKFLNLVLAILLSIIRELKIPITTTIQYKRLYSGDCSTPNTSSSAFDKIAGYPASPDHIQTEPIEERPWETVLVSNELKDNKTWVSSEFIRPLTHDMGDQFYDSCPHLDQIRQLGIDVDNNIIAFRVRLDLVGLSIVIFDSNMIDASPLKIKRKQISIESYGNKGYQNSNFFTEAKKYLDKTSPEEFSDEDIRRSRNFYGPNSAKMENIAKEIKEGLGV